ncbi:MAG: TenA family protein [Bacteroidales bacterium]
MENNILNELWDAIHPIFHKIIKHPFVKHLYSGTIPEEVFSHYLSQDILYLKDDSKALEILSSRVNENTHKEFFHQMAMDGIAIEQALQNDFLTHFDIKKAKQKSPVISAYTQFLLNHAEKSEIAIAASALLPCFWVYNEVGKHIYSKSAKENPFQKWIDTYEGEEFEEYVAQFKNIVAKLSAGANQITKQKVIDAFVKGTELELRFFDEAWERK